MTNLQQFFEGWRSDLKLERSQLQRQMAELQYRIKMIDNLLEEENKK